MQLCDQFWFNCQCANANVVVVVAPAMICGITNGLHPTVTSCYSGCNILLSGLEICSIQPYSMSVYPVSLIYRHRWHFPRTCVWEWYLHYHVHHNWYIHSESVNYNIHNECKCMCDIQYCWLVLLPLCVCFTFAHSARYVYYNILNNIMQESQYTTHCIYLTWYQVRDDCNYKIISFTKMSCRVYFTCSSGECSFQ
jgi:hypothetical protein